MTSVTGVRNALTGSFFFQHFPGKKAAATVRYIAVDFATSASQNGFCTYKLYVKTNIIQKMTKEH